MHDSADEPLLPLPAHEKHPEDLIDMTAMVDIVFFLLIFFLVTSLQALESAMETPTPEETTANEGKVRTMTDYENDSDFVVIRIEPDDSIWVDDAQVSSEQELRVKLRDAKQANSQLNGAMVAADPDATHGTAVSVFDACAGAGLEHVNFTVEEKTE